MGITTTTSIVQDYHVTFRIEDDTGKTSWEIRLDLVDTKPVARGIDGSEKSARRAVKMKVKSLDNE
jgi:hypothetical protein